MGKAFKFKTKPKKIYIFLLSYDESAMKNYNMRIIE